MYNLCIPVHSERTLGLVICCSSWTLGRVACRSWYNLAELARWNYSFQHGLCPGVTQVDDSVRIITLLTQASQRIHHQGNISSFFPNSNWFDSWVLGLDYQNLWSPIWLSPFAKRLITNQTIQTKRENEHPHRNASVTGTKHGLYVQPLGKTISQPPASPPVSYQPPTTIGYLLFLYVSSSSVKNPLSSQGGNIVLIDDFNVISRVLTRVPSFFSQGIMLFSNCKEDSLYPTTRYRTTMELSPHPNDADQGTFGWHERALITWQTPRPIVKMSSWLKLSWDM